MIDFKEVADTLSRSGSVVIIPTDTVYGLAARAVDKEAVARLYKLKDRDTNPGTLVAKDIEQLVELGLTRRYLKAVENYWPGAVSVIIPTSDSELAYLNLSVGSLAVRIPDDEFLRSVLSLSGPLMTSSANLHSQPTAKNILEAKAYFNDSVDAYFDGGDLSGRLPSTLIKIIDDAVEVIRKGAVEIKED